MEENCNTFLIFFLKGIGEEIVESLLDLELFEMYLEREFLLKIFQIFC